MSGFILQLIAMSTMVCDHVAYAFLDNFWPMRMIGRLAFPIYAMFLAEGFRYMKDDPGRVSRHLRGYILLTVLSEPAFDIVSEGLPLTAEGIFSAQNVIFTFLIAFLGLIAINGWKGKTVYQIFVIVLTLYAAQCMHTDYGFAGVLLVYVLYFYLTRFQDKRYPVRVAYLCVVSLVFGFLLYWMYSGFGSWAVLRARMDYKKAFTYLGYIFVAPVLALYNGKQGYRSKAYNRFYKVLQILLSRTPDGAGNHPCRTEHVHIVQLQTATGAVGMIPPRTENPLPHQREGILLCQRF